MKDLKNRFGLLSGRLVPVEQCAPEVDYECVEPTCGGVLRLRAADSEHYRAHLYHLGENCGSSSESLTHHVAKTLVAQRLRDWLSGESPVPLLAWRCPRCSCEIPFTNWLSGCTGVVVEGQVGNRRADVLVERAKGPVALEVRVSHAVDDEKAHELRQAGVPWVEVSGEETLRSPWVVCDSTSNPPVCPVCHFETLKRDIEIRRNHLKAERDRIESDHDRLLSELDARDVRLRMTTEELGRTCESLRHEESHLKERVSALQTDLRALDVQVKRQRRIVAEAIDRVESRFGRIDFPEVTKEIVQSWKDRGARMLPSGAIVTTRDANEGDWRKAVYASLCLWFNATVRDA